MFGGTANLDKWFYIIAKLHAAEAAAMLVYSLYRGADLITSIKYTLTQLVVGFPTYFRDEVTVEAQMSAAIWTQTHCEDQRRVMKAVPTLCCI